MKKRVLIVCGVLVILIIIFILIVIFNKGTWSKEYSLENMKRYVSKSTQMVICLYEENREEVCDNELVRITNSDTLNEFATIIRRGNLLVFTEHGRVYKLPVHKIPMGLKNSSGYDIKTIVKGLTSNIVKVLFEDTVIAASKMVNKNFLTIVTKDNCIKNLDLDDVVNAPPSGFIYIKLNDGDVVRDLEVIPSKCDVIIYSNKKALRVKCTDINHYKRNAAGVIAMSTKNPIDGIEPIYPTDKFIIIITSGGKINKINLSALELSARGKAGNNVINLGKNDSIIKILGATDKDILRVITINNKIDIPVSDIKVGSSISSGQKLIPTRGDKILNCRIKK